jgi:ATP-binding cassette subfamily G (WHITE) protein 2 (SNQ2)
MDTHLPQATVREALLFSAHLRQPQTVPMAEYSELSLPLLPLAPKYYFSVDKCLVMCGLGDYADAIVGSFGVEHRKRTTIGVELAAKVCPYVLLSSDMLMVWWYSLSSSCSWTSLPLVLTLSLPGPS